VSGQARFHPPHVNAAGFPEPERLSSTSALRRVLSHVAVFVRARHRSRGFAAGDPASDASSRLPRSRAEELDPPELSASSSLTGSRGHAPLVDFCNRYVLRARPRSSELRRTTSRSPVTQHFSRSLVPRDIGVELRMAELATGRLPAPPGQRTASRDSSGQGLVSMTIASHQLLPQRSLARELCPNPFLVSDTSCRLPVVRSPMEYRGAPAPDGAPCPNRPGVFGHCRDRRPLEPAGAVAREIGPPRALPREEERVPLHPRCLRSSDGVSVRRPAASSTCCPQPVDESSGAFVFPFLPASLTRIDGTKETRPCSV
jgi:hypothetical protein